MLSGEDILAALGKSLTIHPFDQEELRGASYNLKVGSTVWLHPAPKSTGDRRTALPMEPELRTRGRCYAVPVGATISVLTREAIAVDDSIAGFFLSKTDMVTRGFSHVSVTLNPGWIGPVLVTIHNVSGTPLELYDGETFVKVVFTRLTRRTRIMHNNPAGRADLIGQLLFELRPEDRDYLDRAEFHDVRELRRLFVESPSGRAIAKQLSAPGRARERWLAFGLAWGGMVLAASAPAWLGLILGVTWGQIELVTFVAGDFALFALLVDSLKNPPWRPE